MNPHYIIPVEIEGRIVDVYVLKRPLMDDFLAAVGQVFEVVVFTASLSKYADPLLDLLDEKGVVRYCPYPFGPAGPNEYPPAALTPESLDPSQLEIWLQRGCQHCWPCPGGYESEKTGGSYVNGWYLEWLVFCEVWQTYTGTF